jgi:hypothetical protein
MSIQAKAISMLPKGAILKIVKMQFEKKVDFSVDYASITIDYVNNKFSLKLKGENKEVTKSDKVTEFTDFSDILLSKVTDRLKAKKIDVINIEVFFDKKETSTTVFYISLDNEMCRSLYNDLF